MTASRNPQRVAILGMGAIGRVHARIMHSLGAEVTAILTSGRTSAEAAAGWLADSLGLEVAPCWSTDQLFGHALDAIVIATPPSLHLSQILQAFDRRLPVLCEKPLLWGPEQTTDELLRGLEAIERHPFRALFVNTSNTVFLDVVRDRLPPRDRIERFHFAFHTQGPYRGVGIAEDLLPHALAMQLHLLGEASPADFRWHDGPHEFGCRFRYAGREVEFDLREEPALPKALTFTVNDRRFRRIQEEQGSTYRVFLLDVSSGERIEAPDPFVEYASRFLEYCRSAPEARSDDFATAAVNAKMMAQLIDLVRGAAG